MAKEELIPVLYVNAEGIEMVKCVNKAYILSGDEKALSTKLFLDILRIADAWGDEKQQVIERANPLFRSNRQVDRKIDEIIAS